MSLDGLRFYLLSQVSTTTDEHLRRIRDAGAIRSVDVCHRHHLARPLIGCVSRLSDVPEDPSAVAAIFARDIHDPSAAAYHTLTQDGRPTILILADGVSRSAIENAALHEIFETMGDPGVNDFRQRTGANGKAWFESFELCDKVQGDAEQFDLGRGDPVEVPNVLYPNAFTDTPIESEPYDSMGLVTSADEIRPESYAVRIYGNVVKTEGDLAAKKLAAHTRYTKRRLAATQRAGGA